MACLSFITDSSLLSSSTATDDSILKGVFEQHGKVLEFVTNTTQKGNPPKLYAFITMETRAGADAAIRNLNQVEFDGCPLLVSEARGSAARTPGKGDIKLYVGNLGYDTRVKTVREVFEQYGTVTNMYMPKHSSGPGRNRGFCLVTMAAKKDAEDAIEKLNGFELNGRALRVSEANPNGRTEGQSDTLSFER
jgi:RNA recognition motif-containing protein